MSQKSAKGAGGGGAKAAPKGKKAAAPGKKVARLEDEREETLQAVVCCSFIPKLGILW
jgi:translation initiation factor eIF-2B subunit epsilon